MNTLSADLRTDQQPPIAIPLGHFLVALAFLLAGAALLVEPIGSAVPGMVGVVQAHTLLVGWICLTIMGAMTQFVPVWSGVPIHSRRLAVVELPLVVLGLLGFLLALSSGAFATLPIAATALLAGFLTFIYNIGRTLLRTRPLDRTERHFAGALGCFLLGTTLGVVLAAGFRYGLLDSFSVTHGDVVGSHVTLVVFGGVVLTVVGACYQLAAMFTQASFAPIDRRLQRLEEVALPAGIVVLAVGRGLDSVLLSRLGVLAVGLGILAFTVVLGRLLARSTLESSPTTRRYWLVAVALVGWLGVTVPAWWTEPTTRGSLLGGPGAFELLVVGVFGFVIVGTLYHIVPFVIWLDRYSDRVGLEPVPMVDDLYDDRLERLDFAATGAGAVLLVVAAIAGLPAVVALAGGCLLFVGFALFALNMGLTVHRHGQGGLGGVIGAVGAEAIDRL